MCNPGEGVTRILLLPDRCTARTQEVLLIARMLVAVVVLAFSARSLGHDFWMVPSTFRPASNTPVQIDLRIGDDLPGEAFPRNERIIERFAVWSGGDEKVEPQPVVGRDGQLPAGLVRLAAPGEYVIGYRSKPSAVDLEAEKFEKYLNGVGLEKIVKARADAGKSKARGKEMFSRCAKCIVRTSDAIEVGGVKGFDRVIGQTLELVPLSDPTALKAGETLTLRLLYKGAGAGRADPREAAERSDQEAGRANG